MELLKSSATTWCKQWTGKLAVAMFFCCFLFYSALFRLTTDFQSVYVVRDDLPTPKTCADMLNNASLPVGEQPWFTVSGCSLHNYTTSDTQTCFRRISKQHGVHCIGFIGDSRIRNLYVSLCEMLGKNWEIKPPMRHSDFHFYDRDTDTLLFLRFRGRMDVEIYTDYVTWVDSPAILRPRVIVQGSGLWDLTFGGTFEQSSAAFKSNLSRSIPYMEKLTETTDILWMLQDPTDDRKLDEENQKLRGKKKIEIYNNFTIQMLKNTSIKLWKSARDIALRFPDDTDLGGVHVGPKTIGYKVQLFLNWYCNRHMEFADGTCCQKPDFDSHDVVNVKSRGGFNLTAIHLSGISPSCSLAGFFAIVCIVTVLLFWVCRKKSPPPNMSGKDKADTCQKDCLTDTNYVQDFTLKLQFK